jgi:hypothetical protein
MALLSLFESGLPPSRLAPLCDRAALLTLSRNDRAASLALRSSLQTQASVPALLDDAALWRPGVASTRGATRATLPSTLVALDHVTSAFESLAMAYDTTLPVLVTGPAASGKSALLDAFISTTLAPALPLRLFIDEGSDLKTLLGAYACTDVAGEFRWLPGPITLAVQTGAAVIIEVTLPRFMALRWRFYFSLMHFSAHFSPDCIGFSLPFLGKFDHFSVVFSRDCIVFFFGWILGD